MICCFARSAGSPDHRMLREVARRRRDHAAHLAELDRDETGIGEMGDAQRDVDALVDQVDRRDRASRAARSPPDIPS